MQLQLPFQSKYYRKPNKKEQAIIEEVFGVQHLELMSQIMGDVLDLYPYKSFWKDGAGQKYMCIGCSIENNNWFYDLRDDGAIVLLHQFSLFPDLERYEQNGIMLKTKKVLNN